MAESQKKSKGGRKPKYDYKSEEFLSLVESYAKKGFTDKEIACAIGITPHFSARRNQKYPKFSRLQCDKYSTLKKPLFITTFCSCVKYKSLIVNM